MIEFRRTIGSGEVRSYYLNLSNDHGHLFGPDLDLPPRTKILVFDGRGRVTYAQMHHANQLWSGRLKNWFIDNDVVVGMRILVRFDPNKRPGGLPGIQLIAEGTP